LRELCKIGDLPDICDPADVATLAWAWLLRMRLAMSTHRSIPFLLGSFLLGCGAAPSSTPPPPSDDAGTEAGGATAQQLWSTNDGVEGIAVGSGRVFVLTKTAKGALSIGAVTAGVAPDLHSVALDTYQTAFLREAAGDLHVFTDSEIGSATIDEATLVETDHDVGLMTAIDATLTATAGLFTSGDGTNLWMSSSDDTASARIIPTYDFPRGMTAIGSTFYAIMTSSPNPTIVRVDAASSSTPTLKVVSTLQGDDAHFLASDGAALYFVAGYGIMKLDPSTATAASSFAAATDTVLALAADADGVYWVTGNMSGAFTAYRAPLGGGGTPSPMATWNDASTAGRVDVASDATTIAWHSGGTVWSIAK
jgi:hypothetical protein